MAALTRYTWATLKTEALKRIGQEGNTAAGSRVEHWIDEAYHLIALTWHHHQLDKTAADQALALGATSLALPADAFLVAGLRVKDNASGKVLGRIVPERTSYTWSRSAVRSARPTEYSRLGATLHFDTAADAAYKVDVFYYSRPTVPDFASGGSELGREWDALILAGAVALGQESYWMPNLAGKSAETLDAWAQRLGHPLIAQSTVRDQQDEGSTRPHGEAIG